MVFILSRGYASFPGVWGWVSRKGFFMTEFVTVVVGTQWGDEGKGKLVDLLSNQTDLCIRFQGGGNAGHTVVNTYGEFKLHLIPCGIFNPACTCVMGTGTVIDPPALLEELDSLA